jgi:hypothetical protein
MELDQLHLHDTPCTGVAWKKNDLSHPGDNKECRLYVSHISLLKKYNFDEHIDSDLLS